MEDRFKFRAFFEVPVTLEDGEEKNVSFYIQDVSLYPDGYVGFSQDNLVDVLTKLKITESQKDEIADFLHDNSYCPDDDYLIVFPDCVEQCTGLKDKTGKLIYEGDIVKNISYIIKKVLMLKMVWRDYGFHLDHLYGRPFNWCGNVKNLSYFELNIMMKRLENANKTGK